MIKSAHLTASISRKNGGLFDAVLRLVQSRNQAGEEVRVFGLWDEHAAEDLRFWKPVPVQASKSSWPNAIGRSPEMLAELKNFAPDICHTHGLWLYPSLAVSHYSRLKKRPYLVSPHGMLDPWAMKNSRWKKTIAWTLFEGKHLRGARCLRALCASEAESIRQLGLRNQIAVIPNGIDLPAGPAPAPPPWTNWIEPGKNVLLFLSRIHPKKGLINLLKAWVETRKPNAGGRSSDEWVLAIAGWDQGGHEAELKQLCVDLQIDAADVREPAPASVLQSPPSVIFLGPQFNTAKASCYHYCDAFFLPSFSEGLPMVVLEAWAYSKPVVMTPECNLPEGFQSGAAIKAEATEAGITAGLAELQRMTVAERQAMGIRARGLVMERFTWSRVGEELQAVQEWILGGGTRPDCLLGA